jgi:hypothetical protein
MVIILSVIVRLALSAWHAVLEAPAAKVCFLNSDSPMPRVYLGDPVPGGAKD